MPGQRTACAATHGIQTVIIVTYLVSMTFLGYDHMNQPKYLKIENNKHHYNERKQISK